MITPTCRWQKHPQAKASFNACHLVENPRLHYAGSAEFNLMAHA